MKGCLRPDRRQAGPLRHSPGSGGATDKKTLAN